MTSYSPLSEILIRIRFFRQMCRLTSSVDTYPGIETGTLGELCIYALSLSGFWPF